MSQDEKPDSCRLLRLVGQTKANLSGVTNLYVHLDDGFPDQSGTEEGPEGNQEMTACDPSQVEQRVGDLGAQKTREVTV